MSLLEPNSPTAVTHSNEPNMGYNHRIKSQLVADILYLAVTAQFRTDCTVVAHFDGEQSRLTIDISQETGNQPITANATVVLAPPGDATTDEVHAFHSRVIRRLFDVKQVLCDLIGCEELDTERLKPAANISPDYLF